MIVAQLFVYFAVNLPHQLFAQEAEAPLIAKFKNIEKLQQGKKEGLIVHYPFNGNLKDVSGNELDGYDPSGLTFSSENIRKKYGHVSFSKDGEFFIPRNPLPKGYENRTVAFWFRLDGEVDRLRSILHFGPNKRNNNWIVQIDHEDYLRFDHWEGSHRASTQAIKPNTWYHVVFSFSEQIDEMQYVAKFYIDGKLSKVQPDFKSDLVFGTARLGDGLKFSIDEFRLYSSALTDQQVQQLYKSEKAK